MVPFIIGYLRHFYISSDLYNKLHRPLLHVRTRFTLLLIEDEKGVC